MILVVIDTNVVVSALINRNGNEAFLIGAIVSGVLIPCLSEEILEEYRDVLSRPKFAFESATLEDFFKLLATTGRIFEPDGNHDIELEDSDDEKFVLCALKANAKFLVTGNTKHFPLPNYGSTAVLNGAALKAEIAALIPKP